MVIPVGPPGAQRVLKVVKNQGADGTITTTREDIYGGKIVPFVPFTKLEGDEINGTPQPVAHRRARHCAVNSPEWRVVPHESTTASLE